MKGFQVVQLINGCHQQSVDCNGVSFLRQRQIILKTTSPYPGALEKDLQHTKNRHIQAF